MLLPETPWTREWYEHAVIEGKQPTTPNDYGRLNEFAIQTKADAEGRFQVNGLAAGRWILTCAITWKVPRYVDSFGPGFYYWHSSSERRRLHRSVWPYAYYPWISPLETSVTEGGFAHAVVELKKGEHRKNVIVTR